MIRRRSRPNHGRKLAYATFNQNGNLHSIESFQVILEKERMRCDRMGHVFSLVEFTPQASDAEALVECLRARLRLTDELGWLDENRIGVMLPYTRPEGARVVADSILELMSFGNEPISFEVFNYPSDDLPSGPDLADGGQIEREFQPTQPMEQLFVKVPPWWKRGIDLMGATAMLIILAPLFAAVAVAIKLFSPGPVFFKQLRRGLGGKPFYIFKFRSMIVGAESKQQELRSLNEQDGPAFKISNDPRATRLGRFLRDSSVDELPQLWNVLKGEMSLVGPRPLPCAEADGCLSWQKRRLDVIPGLSCIWQIRRSHGLPFSEWVRMDMEYLDSLSFATDVKILLATVPALLWPRRTSNQESKSREVANATRSVQPLLHSLTNDSESRSSGINQAAKENGRLQKDRGDSESLALLEFAGDLGYRAVGLTGALMNTLRGSRTNGKIGILTYHRNAVHIPGLPQPLHNVTPDRFEEQITTLLARGFTFWPLSRIIEYGASGQTVPPRTVALTFDDGYETVYTQVLPILQKLQQPATVFLCTAYLDLSGPLPFDEWGIAHQGRAAPESYRPLNTTQCLEMIGSGLFEFGSHTHTHADFRSRPDDFQRDLETSLDVLRSVLEQQDIAFAFPFGKTHDGFAGAELVNRVRKTDATCALTTESLLVNPSSDPFGWGRFTVFPFDTGVTLAAKVDGWYSWAPKLLGRFRRTVKRGATA